MRHIHQYARQVQSGFTLIEIILTTFLLAALTAFSIPVVAALLNRSETKATATKITQAIRRAQLLAQGSASDDAWGVNLENHTITIFKGQDFENRNVDFDEITDLSTVVTIDGEQEIIFEKFSGSPDNPATVELTSSVNDPITITVNHKGLVSY